MFHFGRKRPAYSASVYSTVARVLVAAARPAVYAALLDPAAVARWRVPGGMRGQVHVLEPYVGGRIAMSLTYDVPGRAGKTAGATDAYAGVLVELVDGERVVEEVAFASDDPALAGTVTVTTSLRDVPGGTEVELRMDGIPDGVPAEQNQAGAEMALARLARLLSS